MLKRITVTILKSVVVVWINKKVVLFGDNITVCRRLHRELVDFRFVYKNGGTLLGLKVPAVFIPQVGGSLPVPNSFRIPQRTNRTVVRRNNNRHILVSQFPEHLIEC